MSNSQAPVVLLPGLICSDYTWSEQVGALEQYRVVALPGYGLADSFGAMAALVLDSFPGRFALAGHSMGARVALEVYRQAPERIERIALFDTGAHPVQPGEREKREALVDLGRRDGMAALVDTWLPPMVHPDRRDDPAFMAPIEQMCVNAGLATFEAQVRALLARDDQAPILGMLDCPTLIATGSHDEWSPPAQHRAMAATVGHADFRIIADAGHMAPLEAPAQVTELLERWLLVPVE